MQTHSADAPAPVLSTPEAGQDLMGDVSKNASQSLEVQGAEGLGSELRSHIEMLHKLAEGVPGEGNKLVLAGYGEDPDTGVKLQAVNLHFKVGDVDSNLAAVIAMQDEPHRNIYMPLAVYGPGLRRGAKGSEKDVVAALGLVTDFDDEDAHLWLDRLPLHPDYVLETSAGRFQCFYLFDKPASMAEAKVVAQRMKIHTKGDHCSSDMCHVWRVPGCLNWPNKKKVGEGRSPEPQLVKVAVPWWIDIPDHTPLAELAEEIDFEIEMAVDDVPAFGDDDDDDADGFDVASAMKMTSLKLRDRITKPAKAGSRSEDLWYVVRSLVSQNLTDAQILKIIRSHPKGIGNKYVDRTNEDLLSEIGRARHKPVAAPDLLRAANGAAHPNLANAMALLRRKVWKGVLKFNEFTSQVEVHAPPPWGMLGVEEIAGQHVWSDKCNTRATEWAQKEGVNLKTFIMAEAVAVVAEEDSYHPVKDYLKGLVWDGTPRLDNWMVRYLGAPDKAYVHAVSAKWSIGAVARIEDPGCKMDTMLIVEGLQGAQKSMMWGVLGGRWFSDQMGDIGAKDTIMQMFGAWIIEVAELDAMTRSEVKETKRFLTATTDKIRLPYGRVTSSFPRQCVFAGTTNEAEYLRDPTGGRRFWPVPCAQVDIAGLKLVRDQLWAEARARYMSKEKWWLSEDEEKLAQQEQRARRTSDPWEEPVLEYCQYFPHVTTADVLRQALKVEAQHHTRAHEMRVAEILGEAGWVKNQSVRPRRYENPREVKVETVLTAPQRWGRA